METALAKLTVAEMEADPIKWERFELYKGEPVEMTYTKPNHARILMKLGAKIQNWIDSSSGKGAVYGGEGGIKFTDDIRYCYDLAWSDTRLPEEEIPTRSLPLMVEIACTEPVERVSDGNDINKLLAKVEDYLAFGAREVWLVYPARKSIQVYFPDNTARTFHIEDTITPGDWMKGFSLVLKEVF